MLEVHFENDSQSVNSPFILQQRGCHISDYHSIFLLQLNTAQKAEFIFWSKFVSVQNPEKEASEPAELKFRLQKDLVGDTSE